jgi:hypothetical protein
MNTDNLTHDDINIINKEIEIFRENVNRIIPKWKKINTLQCPNIDNFHRRCGNTTRQCDFAIQMIMDGYVVEIKDHYQNGENKLANNYLFNKVMNRLKSEYNYQYLIDNDILTYSINSFEIYFKKEF